MRLLAISLIIPVVFITSSCKVNYWVGADTEFLNKTKVNDFEILTLSLDNLKRLNFNPENLYNDSLKTMGFREFASTDSACIHLVYKYKEAIPPDSLQYHFDNVYTSGNYFQSILKCKTQTVLGCRTDSISLVSEIENELGKPDYIKEADFAYSKYYYREIKGEKYEIRVHKSNYANIEEISIKIKR